MFQDRRSGIKTVYTKYQSMLHIEIETKEGIEYYRLHSDIKKQMDLKRELLSRYSDNTVIKITDNGKETETLKLGDLFTK
jgi:hypothetical protein